ncbi:potassium-transporting ATPase subunit B, partial [Salmonella enterica subsp. enterica]
IVVLAKQKFDIRARDINALGARFVHFTAQTRMSGVDLAEGRAIRKGAADAIRSHIETLGGSFPAALQAKVDEVSRRGSTPLVVSDGAKALG